MRRFLAYALVAVLVVGLVPLAAAAQADPPQVERVSGPNRYATAAAVSERLAAPRQEVVYLATGEEFADALASGPVAGRDGVPILLAGKGLLPDETAAELRRLSPARLVVLGGADAIDDAVVDAAATAADAEAVRVFGSGRVETAAEVARQAFSPGGPVAYVASGGDFPDALAGGAAGGTTGGPVLLTTPGRLPDATREALVELTPERIVLLGGTDAVSEAVADEVADLAPSVDRVSGPDRYATAVAVSQDTFADGADTAYLATGFVPYDALAGAPAATADAGPVLLVPRDCVPAAVAGELERLGVERVVLLGGVEAVTPAVEDLTPCDDTPPPTPTPTPTPSPTATPTPTPEPTPVEVVTTTLTDELTQPWSIAPLPDGGFLVSERDAGRVVEVDADGDVSERLQVDVNAEGEGGLLGLALRGDWPREGHLYAYRTTSDDNEVVRIDGSDNLEVVLDGIPRANIHNGGRIAFGPDGHLYVATGDAAEPGLAQDPDSLAGKVLRVTPTGAIPADNPDPTSPVFTTGHRNVQGLAWDAEDRLFASEFGPGCDDEINRLRPGLDYGWPDECGETRPGSQPPVIVKQPAEASWSGVSFLTDGAIPQWEGDLFVAALRGQRLWRFSFDADGRPAGEDVLLEGEVGRVRDVQVGADGALYAITGNGGDDELLRLGPAD